ncbi:hypothetical protein [Chelativorans sp. AA-79]|uniref:hypothetical protein n=1 Tax=Chelativorans sp. AA-79 TaxID=3028735 RepID=UPI0023F9F542|nr:hypothetical protein [Chelativorans sp. AA-79]WEX07602.1 hypothetical protein PVE73_15975 [Chelativorans sp. AA-79]
MARPTAFAAGFALALSAVMQTATVEAADYVGVYRGTDDICGHRSVLGNIQNNFRYQVTHVPHLPDVGIVDLYGVHLTRHEPRTVNGTIERLYCAGTARLTSGEDRPIWYMIEYGQGFAGVGDNVEFCVLGFDRWNVYNNDCRVLR